MRNKSKLNIIYIDCGIANAEPVKKIIDYKHNKFREKKVKVAYINHGSIAYSLFGEAKTAKNKNGIIITKKYSIDCIFEDSHETIIGLDSLNTLKSIFQFKGKHYHVSLENGEHIRKEDESNDDEREFLNDLVGIIKKTCKEDKDIILATSPDVLRYTPYKNSPNCRT